LAQNFGATIMRSAGAEGGTTVTIDFPTGATQERERQDQPALTPQALKREIDE
jgi:hypothetical protein